MDEVRWDGPYGDIDSIFRAALKRVDPHAMIRDSMSLSGEELRLRDDEGEVCYDLGSFDSILVIGAGKATARMALAIEEILVDRITQGLISVKAGHVEKLSRIECVVAGHPVPDAGSVEAGRRIRALCEEAGERTLIVNLVSGGGSSLLTFPLAWEAGGRRVELGLEDIRAATKTLLACGATIQEVNCVRKHLCAVKGGRLARASFPATLITIILSDVVGDSLGSIASGISTYDRTTYGDALGVLAKYGIADALPEKALATLRAGAEGLVEETPKEGDPALAKARNFLVGGNSQALRAAEARARELGYNTLALSSSVTGEAREIAKFYLALGSEIVRGRGAARAPACVIAGGETTVTMRGGVGKGGRNQEMALSFLYEMSLLDSSVDGLYFFSGATDGNDGPTDAAGAFASAQALSAGRALGLDPLAMLGRHDSYSFFDAAGYIYRTGPTNTNVCDIQILIVR